MIVAQLLFCIILILSLTNYLWKRRKFYILSWKIGSIHGLPFFGSALYVRKAENLLAHVAVKRNKLKNYIGVVWFGPNPMIYVSEPVMIKKMLTSSMMHDKIDLYKMGNKHMGDGLITSNNPIWKNHRKLIDPAFKFKILKNFIPIFNEKSDIFLKKLSEFSGGYEFNLIPIAQLCSLDMACHTTMGKSMKFQVNENSIIRDAYCTVMQTVTTRVLSPIYHSDFIFSLTNMAKRCSNAQEELLNFVEDLIIKNISKESVRKIKSESQSDLSGGISIGKDDVFIDRTVGLLRSNQFSWKDAIDNANVIVAAAFETTANTVSYVLMCLAMFPQYQKKLFDELCSVYPKKDNFQVTYEDITKLTYLDMIINETMRLLSPVPFIGRTTQEEFELSDNIMLPKSTDIMFDIFHMHRDEHIWGENAKTFYPDHFLPENFNKIPSFAFIPFAKGARNCIGWRYAMLALKTILSKVLRKYRVDTEFQFNDLIYLFNLTLKFQKVPLLKIYERQH